MKLLITGANGFLGRHVLGAALTHGHEVRAVVRPTTDAATLGASMAHPKLEVVRHDLRARDALAERVAGVDAVLHLAAAKTGDFYAQMAGTVVATENLLAAMQTARVARLVLVSSFAVYDYLALRQGATLDEASPLEAEPERRDDYCRTKLLQEQVARRAATDGIELTVLRPGVIYAEPGELWTDRLGMRIGRAWLATGSHARLPLTHARSVAEAVVLAAEQRSAVGETFNVVDDDLPTQRDYRRALGDVMHQAGDGRPRVVPLNWTLLRAGAWALDLVNRRRFDGELRLPAVARRRALHARCRPLRYSNRKLREQLGWSPWAHWRDALARPPAVATISTEDAPPAQRAAEVGTPDARASALP